MSELTVISVEAPDGVSDDSSADEPSTPQRGGLLRAVLNAVAVALLAAILATGALAIAVPALTGSTALTVLTSSMEPHLPPGTMVVVRPTDPADVEPGMVLTYQLRSGEPTLITHRVTQVLAGADGERRFITKGDNNAEADADPVREVQMRGTVWYAIPWLGWVAMAITGPHRAIVVAVAVIGLFGYAAWAFGSGIIERVRKRSA
ncbi:signal peptidase I [Microbacterium sp. OR21]|uniref:signal peptidase I n=1 Tax=Microbacterium sp. OR21 TaxID=3095346 RepID=UPI0039B3F220